MEELFSVTSHVIRGVGMGRDLGFPTINLVYPEHSDFETGVYACRVEFPDAEFMGVMHLGPRDTTDGVRTFEVYLLDFDDRDAYDAEVYVEVLYRLREVKRFSDTDELVKQIEKDVKEAEKFFKKLKKD